MKILHISHSDLSGGANYAAYQIHKSLLENDINSTFLCLDKVSKDEDVITKYENSFQQRFSQIKLGLERRMTKYLLSDRYSSYSTGLFGSNLIDKINEINPDIVNLHWVNLSTLSISEISKIKQKIVWTIHDMWPFCATEHYTLKEDYTNGYSKNSYFSLNKYIWNKKKNSYRESISFVCASEWMLGCAKKSYLTKNARLKKIPYAINSKNWNNFDKSTARIKFGFKDNEKIILFGQDEGPKLKRKNLKFLIDALKKLPQKHNFKLVVFGNSGKKIFKLDTNFEISFLGYFKNDERVKLNYLYSAADILAAPSLQEGFGLVAAESLLSGTPVIAFKNTGFDEIITHKVNGYLSEHMNIEDFNVGILWLFDNLRKDNSDKLVLSVKEKFNYSIISKLYVDYYKSILKK